MDLVVSRYPMGSVPIMIAKVKNLLPHVKQNLTLWTLSLPVVVMLGLGSVAYGLGNVIPQLNANVLLSISLFGMLVAWLLASTTIRAAYAILVSLCMGLPMVFVRAGGLESELMASLQAVFNFLIRAQTFSTSGPTSQTPLQKLGADLGTLLDRSLEWTGSVMTGRPIFDPVVTVLVWGIVIWSASFWAGWIVQRTKNALLGILPAGTLLSITLSYMLAETSTLLVFLGTTLFLLGVIQQQSLERRWKRQRVRFYLDLRNRSLLFSATISAALVILAAVIPLISVQDLVELGKRWRSTPSSQTDGIAESLGLSSKPRRERIAIDNVRFSGLPQEQLIGSGPELNEKIVMRIRVVDEEREDQNSTYYWRSITYDKYTGSGWTTSGTSTEPYEADQLVTSTKTSFQQPLTQEVEIVTFAGRLLYYSGTLVTVDQQFLLSQRSYQDIFGASIDSGTYRVDSLSSTFNEAALRLAGNDYPEWIQKRYLALPDDLPQRVRDLALDLTATIQTPYERAAVIETYLRTIPYSLQVPPASRYRDIADHFLFDLKQGYCGYFATTMVVMARAAGLPARIVIGYASNNYDEDSGYYIVSQADAHSWVEVYFPEYGWVEFEPTPNRPRVPRLLEPSTNENPIREEIDRPTGILNLNNLPVNLTLRMLFSGFLMFAGASIFGSILVAVIWLTVDTIRLRFMASSRVVEALYLRLKRFARRMGIPYQEGHTPYEFAAILTNHFNEHYRKGAPLTEVIQPIQSLVQLYVQANYTRHPLDRQDAETLMRSWGTIRRQLSILWLQRKIGYMTERISKKRPVTPPAVNP